MKNLVQIQLLFFFLFIFSCSQESKEKDRTPSSKHLTDNILQPKRSSDFMAFKYEYSTVDLYREFSESIMDKARSEVEILESVNRQGRYKPNVESLKLHEVPEWFEDAKLGIFLDWGPWSVPGYAPLKGAEASTGGSYPDWYEFLMDNLYKEYHDEVWGADFRRDDFLPLLTGENFNSEEYMLLAVNSGAKYFVPFTKHHAGWTMWESEFTKRNAVEMGPGRDIYKELIEAGKKYDMKMGFYFSVSEWEYPVIVDQNLSQWDPVKNLAIFQDALGQIPRATPLASYFPALHDRMISGKIPVKDYFADYMIPSFKEAVDKYDPDLVWYDGGWGSPVSISRTMETSAYFYNQAEGKKDVVINNRAGSSLSEDDLIKVRDLMDSGKRDEAMKIYLSGQQLGDYGTPEFTIGDVDIQSKWEVCRSISPAFGYNWQDDEASSLSGEELIKLFVDIVANNGNLLLVISPDGSGKLPDIQKDRLLELGDWMKVNAESIHNTRPWKVQKENDKFFTKSKDGKSLFVHCTNWPGENLIINTPIEEGIKGIKLLGSDINLQFTKASNGNLEIPIPKDFQNNPSLISKYVWTFKIDLN
ncbi:MAG: alpha-L-fucosidase [Cecembia sp.]